jgi:hypothetical protein
MENQLNLYLHHRYRGRWQHLLLQRLPHRLFLGQWSLQEGREGVAQTQPGLQRAHREIARHESLVQFMLKLDPSRRRPVVCCSRVASEFRIKIGAANTKSKWSIFPQDLPMVLKFI